MVYPKSLDRAESFYPYYLIVYQEIDKYPIGIRKKKFSDRN